MRHLLLVSFLVCVVPLHADYSFNITDIEGRADETATAVVSLGIGDDDPIEGWQLAVCHDNLLIELQDVQTLELGDPVFEGIIEEESYWVVGAIYSFGSETLAKGGDAYEATYLFVGEEDTTLEFCDSGLDSDGLSVVVDGSVIDVTELGNGQVTYIAGPEPKFTIEVNEDISCLVEVDYYIDNSEGDAFEGYQFESCFDEHLSLLEENIETDPDGGLLEFDFETINVTDSGWSVTALFTVGTTLEPGVHRLYEVQYTVEETGIATIEFCEEIQDPPLVRGVTVDGEEVTGYGPAATTFEIEELEDPLLSFDILFDETEEDETTVYYRPNVGEAEIAVEVSLVQEDATECRLIDVEAATVGLDYPEDVVTATAVDLSQALLDKIGDDDYFFSAEIDELQGTIEVGVLWYFVGGVTLQFAEPTTVLDIQFQGLGDALLNNVEGTSAEILWLDNFDATEVTVDGLGYDNLGQDDEIYTIHFVPDNDVHFLRGDADGSGAVFPLVDALYILEWGFVDGDVPPCLDAADVDDNGFTFPIIDSLYLLEYGFTGGDSPPAPGPDECGEDATGTDVNDCETPPEVCE